MTQKKLHEIRHLVFVLGNTKPRLRNAEIKHGIDNEFINILSEFKFN